MGSARSELQPGTIFAGKYRVEGELGRGGMGVVYACRHLHLDQPVALKLVRPELLGDDARKRRLLQEARAMARLRSAHVVRLLDADVLPSGETYLAMERLMGETLASYIERHGSLAPAVGVRLASQVCEVLTEAASQGIIHRDLKPTNLFVTSGRLPAGGPHTSSGEAPLLKVLDFGISKLSDGGDEGAALTSTEAVLGSPPYMSPEQLRSSRQVDARTDVWSLGVVLYEMLTGRRPFDGRTSFEVCEKIVHAPAPSIRSIESGVPVALEAIVMRCLAKRPADRYAEASALKHALETFEDVTLESEAVAPRSVSTLSVDAGVRQLHRGSAASVPAVGVTRAPWAKRRSLWFFALLAVATAIVHSVLPRPSAVEPSTALPESESAALRPEGVTAAEPTAVMKPAPPPIEAAPAPEVSVPRTHAASSQARSSAPAPPPRPRAEPSRASREANGEVAAPRSGATPAPSLELGVPGQRSRL